MFDLRETLEKAAKALQSKNIPFALIGGFALGSHGIHRATQDVDFLVAGEHKEEAKQSLLEIGFKVVYQSNEVLQLEGPGYLDILFANRPLSLEMLSQAVDSSISGIKVVSPEGIIGLKIQAYMNDEDRKLQDLADIQNLINLDQIDLANVKKYADLFNQWDVVKALRKDK